MKYYSSGTQGTLFIRSRIMSVFRILLDVSM